MFRLHREDRHQRRRREVRHLLPLGFALLPALASAHALDLNTARLSLRDGQVEIYAELDPSSLGAEPFVDTLGRGTHLKADGREVPLVVRPATGEAHGRHVPVLMEATASVAGAKALSIDFPPALGPVLVTFVQPQTRLAQAGARTTFHVPTAESRPSRWQAVMSIAAAMLAIAGIGLALRRRR